MAYFHEHCEDCQRILGQPWPEVHKWLDGLACQFRDDHRRHRHHREGIEEVGRMWGEEAARAARIHIIVDCWSIPSAIDYPTGRVNRYGFSEESTAGDVERLLQSIFSQK